MFLVRYLIVLVSSDVVVRFWFGLLGGVGFVVAWLGGLVGMIY